MELVLAEALTVALVVVQAGLLGGVIVAVTVVMAVRPVAVVAHLGTVLVALELVAEADRAQFALSGVCAALVELHRSHQLT